MSRVNIDLEMNEGARFYQPFIWTSGETLETQAAVDLTGWTAAMQVRNKIGDATALLDLADTAGLVIPDQVATPGRYEIDITCATMSGLCANHRDINGVYDLFLFDTLGVCRSHQYGACVIRAAVTRHWEA